MLISEPYIVLTFVHMNINMAPEFSELSFLHSKEHTIFKLNMYNSTHIPEVIKNDEVILSEKCCFQRAEKFRFIFMEGRLGDDVIHER